MPKNEDHCLYMSVAKLPKNRVFSTLSDMIAHGMLETYVMMQYFDPTRTLLECKELRENYTTYKTKYDTGIITMMLEHYYDYPGWMRHPSRCLIRRHMLEMTKSTQSLLTLKYIDMYIDYYRFNCTYMSDKETDIFSRSNDVYGLRFSQGSIYIILQSDNKPLVMVSEDDLKLIFETNETVVLDVFQGYINAVVISTDPMLSRYTSAKYILDRWFCIYPHLMHISLFV